MSLSVKIIVAGLGISKMMRFMGDMSIHEVLKEIREKTTTGGADHGLFEPAIFSSNGELIQGGRWLKEGKTLNFYNITNNVQIIFFTIFSFLFNFSKNKIKIG